MERKPKISPNHTFVFDEEDIEAFDELSMTSVIGEVTDSIKQAALERKTGADTKALSPEPKPETGRAAAAKPPEFDPEIMALMRELNSEK